MNKLNKLFAIFACILLVASFSNALFTYSAHSSTSYVEPKGIDEDVKTAPLDASGEIEYQNHHSYWNIGDLATWTVYRSGYGIYLSTHQLCYIGDTVEIWVQYNINFPSGQTPDRNPPTKPTYAMLQYFADQFEDNILPKESEFFGAPFFHDGSNAHLDDILGLPSDYYYEPSGRNVILVQNIRDTNFYNPNYPIYVIGVHIGDYEDYYYDRNMITVDAISWYHGLGTSDINWGDHRSIVGGVPVIHNHYVTGQYAYDSTVAHEWQHLLHHEYCTVVAAFMNEGCSMFAEYLCGYGIDPDYFNSYFFTPDNSLTEWGDQGDDNILADYGVVALWCMYLADRYGPEFLRLYFLLGTYGIAGIDGINYALYFSHYNERFPEVYRDWKLANLIRADSPGAGKYNYKSIDLNDPIYIPIRLYEETGFPVPTTKGTDYGNTFSYVGGYDTGIAAMSRWGSDYIALREWDRPGFIFFDGDDLTLPTHSYWTLTADGWYSGTGEDLVQYLLVGTAYVDPADPDLTLVTAYGLETLWDYGFVQVSTDGGMTWTSLANEYTTTDHDPAAHPDVLANLPGLTDYNPDWSDWTTMYFDLSAYAGQTVLIGFRYVTDWGTTYEGWWINSATVSGTALTLDNMDVQSEADFQVTVVVAIWADGKYIYVPYDMSLDDATETGKYNTFAREPTYAVLIVTPTMDKGIVDYEFSVKPQPISPGKIFDMEG